MKKCITLFLSLGIIIASPSLANSDLANALKAKKVCEKDDGYIKATPGHEPEMAHLITKVNNERQKVYADIAKQENIQTEIVAGQHASQEKASHPEKFCR